MDRGKRHVVKSITSKNSKIYLNLKDIIRENALPFLPAKSLLRSTIVCREWCLTIRSPFFIHQHSNSFHGASGLFVQSKNDPPTFISFDPMAYGVPDPLLRFLPEAVSIVSSSNGLLCCQGRKANKLYYVCNPVTQKWNVLPKHNSVHGSDPAVVLIFEPSLLNFMGDYKMVCAFKSELDGYEFEIYSSTDSTWRVSDEILFGTRKIDKKSGIHVNGVVYWQTNHNNIIAFDMNTERSTLLSGCGGSIAGVLNGRLCSVYVMNMTLYVSVLSNAHSNTMGMNGYKLTWEKIYEINMGSSVNTAGSERETNGVAVASLDGVLSMRLERETNCVAFVSLDGVVSMRLGNVLLTCNLNTKIIKRIAEDFDVGAKLLPYVNSLVGAI